MPFRLLYHPAVPGIDLKLINRDMQARMQRAIEQRLAVDPLRFGEPLRKSLKGYRKLRVGDYRIIYDIAGDTVRIYTIGHRREVYEGQPRRWT